MFLMVSYYLFNIESLPLHAKIKKTLLRDEKTIYLYDDARRLYDGYGTDEADTEGTASGS